MSRDALCKIERKLAAAYAETLRGALIDPNRVNPALINKQVKESLDIAREALRSKED